MLILLSLHSSLRLSPSVMADTTLQPPTPHFQLFQSLLATSVNSSTSPKLLFLDECWHLPLSHQLIHTEWCYLPPAHPLYLFLYCHFLSLFFFFWYFSLSLQTDIHASLHMGFNLPLSPKIFLAQAWDKGIITSKGSWGGDCPLPPSWKEKWTIR